jgi:hypothetical protein
MALPLDPSQVTEDFVIFEKKTEFCSPAPKIASALLFRFHSTIFPFD